MANRYLKINSDLKFSLGVPTVAQRDQQHLWSPGTKVQFLAWHSELRIQLKLWCRLQLWLESDPWPGNSAGHGTAKKEKKNSVLNSVINEMQSKTTTRYHFISIRLVKGKNIL